MDKKPILNILSRRSDFLFLDINNIKTRDEADNFLADKIKNKEIRQFLLKNLYRKDDLSFGWRLNLESLNNNLGSIGGYFTDSDTFEKETLFPFIAFFPVN